MPDRQPRLESTDPRDVTMFVDARVARANRELRAHIDAKFAEQREWFSAAFPRGDVAAHRMAHERQDEAEADPIPEWSSRRPGRAGGVRLKRINVRDASKWLLVDVPWADPRAAAQWCVSHQGALYDWQGVFGFIAWPVPHKDSRWACHEVVAAALGHPAPSRTDPAALCETLLWRLDASI